MLKDEKGYIVVETVGAFTLFVFFMASILALVSVVALQSRVHYAITQTAQTISMYSYIYEITGNSGQVGVANANSALRRAGVEELKTGMGAIAAAANIFSGDSQGGQGNTALDAASDLFSDPSALISMYLGGGDKSVVLRQLIGRYLRNGTMSGDQYLKFMGVSGGINGLQIMGYDYGGGGANRPLVDSRGSITITVRYEVDYSFWGLPLPFSKLSMTQSAATRAWLGGEGVRYTG